MPIIGGFSLWFYIGAFLALIVAAVVWKVGIKHARAAREREQQEDAAFAEKINAQQELENSKLAPKQQDSAKEDSWEEEQRRESRMISERRKSRAVRDGNAAEEEEVEDEEQGVDEQPVTEVGDGEVNEEADVEVREDTKDHDWRRYPGQPPSTISPAARKLEDFEDASNAEIDQAAAKNVKVIV